jgi:ABC-2 type transport system ATP-binding protein
MATIEVENLSKIYESYRKKPGLRGSLKGLFHRETFFTSAVDGISFSVSEGELVGFLGPNGAGKTTTLKMLSGILYPTSGDARVLGYTPARRQREYQKQFALVMGQKNQLWWDLPARESILLNKEIYEIPDGEFERNLAELSDLLEIRDILDVPVRKLSLGQRMKCELVTALIHDPKVLFLDEPTIGLDVVAQKNIRDFIRRYNQDKKTTVLLTSHYMEDISQLCDRVIIIDAGRIVFDGRLADLIQAYAPHKVITVTFADCLPSVSRLQRYGELVEAGLYKAILRIPREDSKRVAADLLSSDLPVDDILIGEVAVDEVVRKIFQDRPGTNSG